MVFLSKKFVLGGVLLLMFALLVACGSAGGNSTSGSTGINFTHDQATPAITAIIPHQVPPKVKNGVGGKGPLVAAGHTPVSGGQVGSRQIVLSDRTLLINSISKQQGVNANSTLVNLNLTVQNTGSKTIQNKSTFFVLMGTEGDTFEYQYNSSDNFYGPMAAHAIRQGIITFQVPTAAAATPLNLLYRPEIVTETALVLLKIS